MMFNGGRPGHDQGRLVVCFKACAWRSANAAKEPAHRAHVAEVTSITDHDLCKSLDNDIDIDIDNDIDNDNDNDNDNDSDDSLKTDYRVRLVGGLELSHIIGPQL